MIKAKEEKDLIRKFLEKIVVNAGVGRLSDQPNFSAEGGSASPASPSEAGRAGGKT